MVQKVIDGTFIDIINSCAIAWYILPIQSHFLQEKLVQSVATKFLLCSTATKIIYTFVRDRHSWWVNYNLNYILAIHHEMIGFWENSGIVDNLVGNIFQLLMESVHTNNTQIIVNANVYLAAMSIGKSGYPFQIFVFPDTLMLYILVLLIHIAKLLQNLDIHNRTVYFRLVRSSEKG